MYQQMSAENNTPSNTGEIWTNKLGHMFTKTQGERQERGLWSGRSYSNFPIYIHIVSE